MRRQTKRWSGIAIHHSLTADSNTVSWEAIKRYHTNTKGWGDIGYHFGVELVDGEIEVFAGRSLRYHGAHCPSVNRTHIGICLVGNYDIKIPSEEHIFRLKELCLGLMQIYRIDCSDVVYHSDYSSKSCPGNLFPKQEFIESLKREM